MIDLNELIITVRDMRQAQKAYFKDRSRDNLIKSKELEKKVDELLTKIKA